MLFAIFRDVYPFIYFTIAMYVHHLGYILFYFADFLSPNQCNFAVDKVMIKESYYYYYYFEINVMFMVCLAYNEYVYSPEKAAY